MQNYARSKIELGFRHSKSKIYGTESISCEYKVDIFQRLFIALNY